MWELIRESKIKSVFVFIGMGTVLILLGYVLGVAYGGDGAGIGGIFVACVVWIILSCVSYAAGDSILLASSRAVPVTHDVHPQLFNIVEEMAIAASMKKIPRIYIINEDAPNAFATGRSAETATIAVTTGLLAMLNRDELQGVVAHEMGHIKNRDIVYLTFAGVMMGSIALLSEGFLRSMYYSSHSMRYRSSSRNNQGHALVMVIAILFAILSPLIARLFYFSLSRKREYLADATAVVLTRYPEGLASALEKISSYTKPLAVANSITAPMYIVTPFRGSGMARLFSTHPPVNERIRILRGLSGASFSQYNELYKQTYKKTIVPASVVQKGSDEPLRKGTVSMPEPESKTPREKERHIGDMMRQVDGFRFVPCPCGVVIKVPPEYKRPGVVCPRCLKMHALENSMPLHTQ